MKYSRKKSGIFTISLEGKLFNLNCYTPFVVLCTRKYKKGYDTLLCYELSELLNYVNSKDINCFVETNDEFFSRNLYEIFSKFKRCTGQHFVYVSHENVKFYILCELPIFEEYHASYAHEDADATFPVYIEWIDGFKMKVSKFSIDRISILNSDY